MDMDTILRVIIRDSFHINRNIDFGEKNHSTKSLIRSLNNAIIYSNFSSAKVREQG
jgi:hypothetical protein